MPPHPNDDQLWEAPPWVVASAADGLHRRKYLDPAEADEALRRLAGGEPPREVFGWTGERLPVERVRSVEWVPEAKTVLVRRGWWRDPWRLTFPEGPTGERLFHHLAGLLPGAGQPVEAKVGPNDLTMDPRVGVGVLLAGAGLIALIGGAVEGVGQAPVQGPARRFTVFAELGEAIGIEAVLGIGAIALTAGVAGLVWWYRRRARKLVVRPRSGAG